MKYLIDFADKEFAVFLCLLELSFLEIENQLMEASLEGRVSGME